MKLIGPVLLIACQLAVLTALWHLNSRIWHETHEITWLGVLTGTALSFHCLYVLAMMPTYLSGFFLGLGKLGLSEQCQAISVKLAHRVAPFLSADKDRKSRIFAILPLLWTLILVAVLLPGYYYLRQVDAMELQISEICKDKAQTEKCKSLVEALIALEGPYLGPTACLLSCESIARDACIMAHADNYPLAEWVAEKGLQYRRSTTPRRSLAYLYYCLAKSCERLPNKLGRAEEAYKEALSAFDAMRNQGVSFEKIHCLMGLSRICRQTKRYDLALKYATSAMDESKALCDTCQELTDSMLEQVAALMESKNYEQAEKISAEALKILDRNYPKGKEKYRELMPALIARQDALLALSRTDEAKAVGSRILQLDRKHITAAELDAATREQIMDTVLNISNCLLTMQYEEGSKTDLKRKLEKLLPADYWFFETQNWFADGKSRGKVKSAELFELDVGVGPYGEDYSVRAYGRVRVGDRAPENFGYNFSIDKRRSDGKPGLEIRSCRRLQF